MVAGSTPTGCPEASVTEMYTVTVGNFELSTCVIFTWVPPLCAIALETDDNPRERTVPNARRIRVSLCMPTSSRGTRAPYCPCGCAGHWTAALARSCGC